MQYFKTLSKFEDNTVLVTVSYCTVLVVRGIFLSLGGRKKFRFILWDAESFPLSDGTLWIAFAYLILMPTKIDGCGANQVIHGPRRCVG